MNGSPFGICHRLSLGFMNLSHVGGEVRTTALTRYTYLRPEDFENRLNTGSQNSLMCLCIYFILKSFSIISYFNTLISNCGDQQGSCHQRFLKCSIYWEYPRGFGKTQIACFTPRISYSVCLRRDLRTCISNKLSVDITAAGLRISLWEPVYQTKGSKWGDPIKPSESLLFSLDLLASLRDQPQLVFF